MFQKITGGPLVLTGKNSFKLIDDSKKHYNEKDE